MRAFLREPSTPWIVFDQETRPTSQLAVGELLPAAMSSIAAAHGFFPATAAVDAAAAAHAKIVEPSSLAVASDLVDDEPKQAAADVIDDAPDFAAIPMRGVSRRFLGAAAATVGIVAVLAVGAFALRSASHQLGTAHASNAVTAPRSFGAPADPIDIPPPDFDVSAQAAKLTGTSAPAAPAAAAPRDESSKVSPTAKKYGRLTVAGDARGQDVYFDGKRMLGRGARSFTVMCGKHTVAVGAKSDAHDVEIACTGTAELVVGK